MLRRRRTVQQQVPNVSQFRSIQQSNPRGKDDTPAPHSGASAEIIAFRQTDLATVLETVRVLRMLNDRHVLDNFNRAS